MLLDIFADAFRDTSGEVFRDTTRDAFRVPFRGTFRDALMGALRVLLEIPSEKETCGGAFREPLRHTNRCI